MSDKVDVYRPDLYKTSPLWAHPPRRNDTVMNNTSFELDLIDFQGAPLRLDFEVPGVSAPWLLEGIEAALKIDEDKPFRAELDAQLVESSVYLDGHIEGTFHYQCGRCLEWREIALDESVDFVLMSRSSWDETYEREEEIALDESDLDVSYYEEEVIDLRPILREAVLLKLPTFPRCTDALSDACDTAYERLVGKDVLDENEAQSIDIRWSKLREIELGDD